MAAVFWQILGRILPLYGFIFLGYLAGRFLKTSKETIASLLIYMIVPGVAFYGVLTTPLDFSRLSLPFVIFGLCLSICFVSYAISKRWLRSPGRNIYAFASGTGNMGYFGLPVATFVLGEGALGPVIFSVLGLIVFENTIGFFLTARGHHTTRESLMRVMRLPSIYAIALAMILNFSGVRPGEWLTLVGTSFRGTYTVLGMMLVGLAASSGLKIKPHFGFLALCFFSKFLMWPLLMFLLVRADVLYLHWYDPFIHKILFLLSAVPLAANTVAVATELKAEPENAAFAVLTSTLFALVFIPLVVSVAI